MLNKVEWMSQETYISGIFWKINNGKVLLRLKSLLSFDGIQETVIRACDITADKVTVAKCRTRHLQSDLTVSIQTSA